MIDSNQDFICHITQKFKDRVRPYYISYVTESYQEFFLCRQNGKFFVLTMINKLELGLPQVHPIRLFNGHLTLKEATDAGNKFRRTSWENKGWAFTVFSSLTVSDAISSDWEVTEWKFQEENVSQTI